MTEGEFNSGQRRGMFLRFHGVFRLWVLILRRLFIGHWWLFFRGKAGRDMQLTTHAQLMPILMRAAVTSTPHSLRSERGNNFTLATFPYIFFCCSYFRLSEDCQQFFKFLIICSFAARFMFIL